MPKRHSQPAPAEDISAVEILVPATTANLGPGFDALGVALSLSNRIRVAGEKSADSGGLERPFPMAAEAGEAFFAASGIGPFPFRIGIAGDVPRSRGLGSSVTVRLGVLMGLDALCGGIIERGGLFRLCADLEGHPDNAAPACFGGFALSWEDGAAGFAIAPRLKFALFIPDFEMGTAKARNVLPKGIPRGDAVRSAANAARITAAFATGDYDLLAGAFWDGLHQPYRKPLIPFLDDVIAAGEEAGAYGGFLSGSGSAICCPAPSRHAARAAEAMAAAAKRAGIGGRAIVTGADNLGARVIFPKAKEAAGGAVARP